ncbi:ribosomal protein S5 domain 2-like protein [Phellopilus nigrolimitatus]|nr:ribosomal protein S5 domain 2-like protein [Phellopilus nigrolimitatus]
MASSSKSEQAYIRSSLLATPPLRPDGRALDDYRPIALETQVAPLANGSARVNIGGASLNGVGGRLPGTEVIAAVKLEVEDVVKGAGRTAGGWYVVSPSAYPQLVGNAVDDLQHDLTALVHDSLSHPSLQPKNLAILPGKKAWLLPSRFTAALRDTRVPKTRSIEYKARSGGGSAIVDRMVKQATDFELLDYWDEGEPLKFSGSWPVCVTLNLVPPVHYLDASSIEESATTLRLLLLFTFHGSSAKLQGMRLIGSGETDASVLNPLLRQGEGYARDLQKALDVQLQSERSRRYPK